MLWCLFLGVGADIGYSVCLSVFFFFLVVLAVADIGGRWLICEGGRWLWAVVVDLRCGLLMIIGEGIIYYFNVLKEKIEYLMNRVL